MRGYDRDELDQTVEEYDDYDEYEGDDQEEEGSGEEEYEEEAERKPTEEELEYLALRQRLKEQIRTQMKKESGSGRFNSNEKKKLPYDNYGSFFGPSQPVIAQRVIQESKSLLETQHLAPRLSNSLHGNKKSSASNPAGSKVGIQAQRPKVVNQLKTKVQKLKDTRDYSFLLSEDAELPAPAKEPPPRNVSVPNSVARSAHVPMKNPKKLVNPGRHVQSGHEERKTASMNGQMQSKHVHGHEERKPVSMNGQMQSKLMSSRPNSLSMESRKQLGSKSSNVTGRPVAPKGSALKASGPTTQQKKDPIPGAKNSMPSQHKPLPSKLQSSVPRHHLEQKKELREPIKANKMMPRTPAASSKPQLNKPQRQISSHPVSQDRRPKKRPARPYSDDEDNDEGGKAISMIRKMFGYNPARFSGRDDDDSDMEANFDDILKEERRSAKIAKKEDEEQLRLIEEEEERERQAKLRRLKKKRLQR